MEFTGKVYILTCFAHIQAIKDSNFLKSGKATDQCEPNNSGKQ